MPWPTYNIGNILGEQQQWDQAAESFRRALRQNPDDEEAKFNFELANRNLQQQQQQQQNQPQDNSDEDQEQQQNDEQSSQQQPARPE